MVPKDDIIITKGNFIQAVKEVRANSAPGKDGIPAFLLRKTTLHLANLLYILWNESPRRKEIPTNGNIGKISPNYKGGDKRRKKHL